MKDLIDLYKDNQFVVTVIAIGGGLVIALLQLWAASLGRTQKIVYKNNATHSY